MRHFALALFVLWFLSLEFYLYVPALVSVLLGVALVSTASVVLADWLAHRSALRVDRAGSLGL